MKKLKVVFVIGAVLFLTSGTFMSVLIIKEFTRSYTSSFNHVNYRVYTKSGKVRLKSRTNDKNVSPKFDRIFKNFSSHITVYANEGKRGYIDQYTGKILLDAEKYNWAYAYEFDEKSGLAAVVEFLDSLQFLGFIDFDGNYVIPPTFSYDYSNYRQMGFRFRDGISFVPGEDGSLGLINEKGEVLVPPVYSWISSEQNYGYRVVEKFAGGCKKYGLLDSCFNITIPVKYASMDCVEQGIILGDHYRKRMVAYNDTSLVITENIWDRIEPLYYELTGANLTECSKIFSGTFEVEVNYKYGVIDSNGKVIIEPYYDGLICLNPKLYKAELKGESLLLDGQGNFIQ